MELGVLRAGRLGRTCQSNDGDGDIEETLPRDVS